MSDNAFLLKIAKQDRLFRLDAIDSALECRDNFKFFLVEHWDLIEPSMPLIDAPHIDAICTTIQAFGEGRIKRLVINIPPGHAKSNIISVAFPAWMWLRDPAWRSLFGSYEAELAIRDSKRTREVITSEKYETIKRDLGLTWQLKDDSNRQDLFVNTASGFRMATSVGGKGTGWRVDCTVADDPLNAQDAKSEAKRESSVHWFTKTLSSRHKDPRNAKMLIIMQRLHTEDLSGVLLRSGTFEHLCLPSEYNPDRPSRVYATDAQGNRSLLWEDWREERGELLFPFLYTREALDAKKRIMGSEAYEGQYNQQPTPPEGGAFKRKFWRFWKPDGVRAETNMVRPEGSTKQPAIPLPVLEQTIISLDAAFKDGAKNDFVCFVVIGVHKADRFILDVLCKKLSFTATLTEFRRLVAKYPRALRKLVEDKANGSAIINTLSSEISGILGVEPQGGKESRAAAVQPQIESGNVYLCEGADWVDEFIQEFADFPLGAHDDQVDAVSQGLIYLSASPAMSRAIAMSKM